MAHLEAIARLAWSDEAARGELARLHGVQAILKCMLEVRALVCVCSLSAKVHTAVCARA